MENFEPFILEVPDLEKQEKLRSIYIWMDKTYPNLGKRIAWNQPMFIDHDTFIIAYSASKKHISVAPELPFLEMFKDEIDQAGYERSKALFKIKWETPIDFDLLKKIIDYTLVDKKDCTTFWKK